MQETVRAEQQAMPNRDQQQASSNSNNNNNNNNYNTRKRYAESQHRRSTFAQQRSASGHSSMSSQTSAGSLSRRPNANSIRRPNGFRRLDSSVQKIGARSTSMTMTGACCSDEADDSQQDETTDTSLLASSSADYERIRNETLLFFLDRLYLATTEGREARTLHDLSCLFGTREFTREMRQIVGASRNGLKKFLQSFPSLFQIDGDKVYLTQLQQGHQSSTRDYNKEAREYFQDKLMQFGTSLVPICNLFGYRSQASQEVRHISGKNVREFKRFLNANDDIFELLADGEHVMLKSLLNELRANSNSPSNSMISLQMQNLIQQANSKKHQQQQSDEENTTSNGCDSLINTKQSQKANGELSSICQDVVTMDPYLNKRFAILIDQCLKRMHKESGQSEDQFKVSLERLMEKIKLDCQNELFLKMVNTIDDLKVFLRMHPKLFKRSKDIDPSDGTERDYVGLVVEQERRELDSGVFIAGQHTALARTMSSGDGGGGQSATAKQSAQAQVLPATKQIDSNNKAHERRQNDDQTKPTTTDTNRHKAVTTPVVTNSAPKHSGEHKTQTAKAAEIAPVAANNNNNNNDKGPNTGDKESNNKSTKSKATSQQAQLRANAPPFVPHTRKMITQQQQQQPLPPQRVQRSVSNLDPRRSSQATSGNFMHPNQIARRPYAVQQPNDQQVAIRDYITRPSTGHHNNNLHWSIAASSAKNQYNHQTPKKSDEPMFYGSTHHIQQNDNQQVIKTNQQQQQHHHHHHHHQQQRQASVDELRNRTIDIVRETSNIITRIMNTTDAIALDFKCYNLGFDGQITLIQIGFLPTKSDDPLTRTIDDLNATMTEDNNNTDNIENKAQPKTTKCKPEVCVFDLITNPELAYCLKLLLESDKIVKVVHDVRNKSNALYVQFKIMLNNVFDTQVANLVIQQQDTGKPAYKSRYISMSKLCEVYGDEELLKYRSLIKSKTRHSSSGNGITRSKDVNYWLTRPLTKPMIYESTMDVYCLIGGIYQNLKSKLKPEYEPLFEQLNLESILSRIKPEEIKSAKKGRKIDLEVIDLKRKLYRDATGPVVLSNREIRLLRHIDLTEEVRQKIQQCKKVAKKLERLDMKVQQQSQQTNQTQSLSRQNSDQNGQSNRENDPQSLVSSSSTGETSISTMTTSTCSNEQQLVEDEERILSSFMDSSSMFDELKDKMIESSSLLDSIEDSLRTPL